MADNAQQAFSSDSYPAAAFVVPALERLHKKWSKYSDIEKKPDFERFVPALEAGLKLIEKYHDKTARTDVYILSQGM
jgi:hypothetical protein